MIPLVRYQDLLWAVTVSLGGEEALFLLDTAAGLTVLDRATAERLGVTATGRYAGRRMTGDVVELDLADDVDLTLGERAIAHPTVGIFDLMRLLPPGWPPVGGAIGLPTFLGTRVCFDFERSALELDAGVGGAAREIRIRVKSDGPSLDVFAEVRAGDRSLWFEVDTANTGPVILAPATVAALGLAPGCTEATLDLAGFGPVKTPFVERGIRYDGNLGAAFFATRPLTLDVAAARGWVEER